jgi:hypothetical protein
MLTEMWKVLGARASKTERKKSCRLVWINKEKKIRKGKNKICTDKEKDRMGETENKKNKKGEERIKSEER